MKRRLALLAVIPLLAACSSKAPQPKNHLIVLDRSIGGVALLERRAQIERTLGKGVPESGGPVAPHHYVAYVDGKLDVYYGRNYALIIKTSSPRFRTLSGVGVGSSAREMRTLGGINCFGGSSECQHGYHPVGQQRGTTFRLGANGTVKWIALALGH